MKTYLIIIKNIGLIVIYIFISSTAISVLQSEGMEINVWYVRLLGAAMGIYFHGKILLELEIHK